jgi:iron complex outermembrane recepter protein
MNPPNSCVSLASCVLAFAPCLLIGGTEEKGSAVVAVPGDEPAKLDKLVVTAGHGSAVATMITAPVEVISTEDIQRFGVTTTIQEALRKIVPQFMGSGNIGAENQAGQWHRTGGGSSLALRNLRTLVLIGGRRASVSPVAAHVAGNQFVDLNVIPLSAIHSVEILRDGGSALYGADAVGGVVNITLASALRGGSVGGFYENAPRNGGWENRGMNFSLGHERGRMRLVIAGGWNRQDPLWQHQRAFSNPIFNAAIFSGQISIAGNSFVLNPALTAPPVAARLNAPRPIKVGEAKLIAIFLANHLAECHARVG